MSARAVYLDSSAFVKLVMPEAETGALRRYLGHWPVRVSATLLRAEALRAALRVSGQRVADTRRLLRDVALIEMDRSLMDRAGTLMPGRLRSLDAIHIAAALSLGDDLGEIVTYDERMAVAASAHGLLVTSPH